MLTDKLIWGLMALSISNTTSGPKVLVFNRFAKWPNSERYSAPVKNWGSGSAIRWCPRQGTFRYRKPGAQAVA